MEVFQTVTFAHRFPELGLDVRQFGLREGIIVADAAMIADFEDGCVIDFHERVPVPCRVFRRFGIISVAWVVLRAFAVSHADVAVGCVSAASVRVRLMSLLAADAEEVFALGGDGDGDGDAGLGHGVAVAAVEVAH